MKRALAILLLSAYAAACTTKPAATVQSGQTIVVDEATLVRGLSDTLRFGRMHTGETAVKHLRLLNATQEPLIIVRRETSCLCTQFTYDRQPVLPGQSTDIECTFDSSGAFGWQMKLVKLYISGSGEPLRIFIEADVEP